MRSDDGDGAMERELYKSMQKCENQGDKMVRAIVFRPK